MKALLLSIALMGFSHAALAGYGAIAYSKSTGAYGNSAGAWSLYEAEQLALAKCGQYDCRIRAWEHNRCIALATGYGHWAEAHGQYSANGAIYAAELACGPDCTWRVWSCR